MVYKMNINVLSGKKPRSLFYKMPNFVLRTYTCSYEQNCFLCNYLVCVQLRNKFFFNQYRFCFVRVSVHSHMVDLIRNKNLPVLGVYFGNHPAQFWTADDILDKKPAFTAQFTHTCSKKEQIYAKVSLKE